MSIPTSRVAGRIAYRSGSGVIVGRESFELLGHAGGHSLRAVSEMDDIDLLRDTTIAFDRDWRPLDGFARVTRGGRTEAAIWIGIGETAASLEGQVLRDGAPHRISERKGYAAPPAYLGLHPLQGDALIVNCLPADTPPGSFVAIDTITKSHSPDGDQDYGLRSISIDLAFIGHETIEVTAGRFAARRFAIRWRDDWPAADLWVREQDAVALLLRWSLVDRWYELCAIEE